MRKKRLMLTAVAMATVLTAGAALSACNDQKPLTDEPLVATKIVDYTTGAAEDRAETFASGSKGYSWENGAPFNNWWNPDLVTYDGGKMSLAIAEMPKKEQVYDEEQDKMVDCYSEYYGGEARTEHYYGFGDFKVSMKPAKVVGTVSTFFTCTGPYDRWYDEDGETVIKTNKHDEIDIEFLGKDTTKVQFNYFANGKGGHEYMYSLGFDASKEYHDYGFRWTENYITWFVDDKPVYRVDRADKKGESWPETPGRMIMNYWCARKPSAWAGNFADDYSGRAEYEYVATSAEAQPDPNTAHIKEQPPVELDVPTTGWTDIDYSGFGGWSGYTIDKTDGITMSHSEAKSGYACEGMSLADSYSYVKFKIKNNDATNAADLRIDIKKEGGKGGVEAVAPANEKVSLNTADSAVMIKLDAGEEQEIAVKIKDMIIDQFVVFLNSMDSTSATAGSVTITELKGIVNGEVTPPEPAGDSVVTIGDNEVEFGGNYDITYAADKSSMTVEYTDLSGKSYWNTNTGIAEFVGDNNLFTVTIKNEGEQTAKVRIDIGCDTVDGSTQLDGTKNNFCNVSAEYVGTTVATGNDYGYGGGDWVQIAAGATITAKITFTANVAKDVKFFIDSSTWDDEGLHTGKVIFSDMSLSKVEGTVTPTPAGDSCSLTFTSTEDYTVDNSGTAAAEITVTYTAVEGATYKNIAANVADLAADKDTFTIKIKNNGDRAVTIRIDLIGENKITVGDNSNMECCNVSSTAVGGTDSYTDTTWGGTMITVAAGEEATVTITYTNTSGVGEVQRVQIYLDSSTYGDDQTHSGNVTFGEFTFAKAESEAPEQSE